MASDILFNFYELLVENVFGSIGLAIMGVALLIVLILAITRTSNVFLVYWLIFYFIVMSVGYIGGVAFILAFLILAGFLMYNIIKVTTGEP